MSSCAKSLGALHRITKTLQIGGKRWKNDPFELSATRLEEAQGQIGSDLLETINMLEEHLKIAWREMSRLRWEGLSSEPIHGDYCHFNCRFAGDIVASIVDWDHARLAPRTLDLAHFLGVACGWPVPIDHYEDFRWSATRVPELQYLENLLRCYATGGGRLCSQECELLPWTVVALWPQQVVRFYLHDEGFERSRAVVDFSEFFIENSSQIFRIAKNAVA